jgi:hypothetical protein
MHLLQRADGATRCTFGPQRQPFGFILFIYLFIYLFLAEGQVRTQFQEKLFMVKDGTGSGKGKKPGLLCLLTDSIAQALCRCL